jgi:integrase
VATLVLTDKAVRAAKAKAGERLELWDATTPGLCLRVSGIADKAAVRQRRVWVYRYRTLDGRMPRLTLGDFTDRQGVKWAREQAADHRAAVRKGADPSGERRRKRTEARLRTIRTFNDLADAYLAACRAGDWMPKGKRQSERTIRDADSILKRHVRPELGALLVEDLTRARIRQFLRDMRANGIGTQVNRTQAIIRQAFAYAIAEYEGKLVAVNPALGNAIVQELPRKRVFSELELKAVWAGLQEPSALRIKRNGPEGEGERVYVSRAICIALQLAALLLQRRGEIAGMMMSELNLPERTWRIVPARMKGRREHVVPLPPLSIALIEEAIRLGEYSRETKTKALRAANQPIPNDWPVFCSPRDATKPVTADALTHALAMTLAALGIKGASTHDLRRTGSTALTSERLGVSPFTRSLVLSHTTSADGGASVSREHYDANSYLSEKRRALEAWEGLLLEIVGERVREENVRALRPTSSAVS